MSRDSVIELTVKVCSVETQSVRYTEPYLLLPRPQTPDTRHPWVCNVDS